MSRASGTDLQHSPTLIGMTQAGVILGTAAYMSPEQARGKRVDHRADIWAYGVVLFEMLTGKRLFEGETASDTLAGVLRADVPWDALPHNTPPTLRRIITRCLERDVSRRLQAIAEARIALEDLKTGRRDESVSQPAAKGDSRWGRERLVWMLGVVVLAAVVAAMALRRTDAPMQPMVQSTLLPPSGWDFAPASPFAVSPDGSQIGCVAIARPGNETAAAGSKSIWICDLVLPEPRRLADTDGYPFWSPDGRWIAGYETSASGLATGYAIYDLQERSLRRLALTSGSAGAAGWLADSRHLALRGADGVVIYDTVAGTTRTILAEPNFSALNLARAGEVLMVQRELLDSEIWLLDFE